MKKVLFFILIAVMFSTMLLAREDISRDRGRPLQKAMVTSDFWMDINRMNGVFRNTGIWMFDCIANDWGLEWPKGSGLSPVFGAGQYICAKVGGQVRVAGVQHSATEYQAGIINPDGTASNPRDGAYKWYAIAPGGAGDWANWPVDQGAPVDADGNPLLIGDKTAFSVWNDLGEHSEYGSEKLGAEVRQTIFAFNRADAMGDMIYIKWQIVNKSSSDWDSTYMAIWVDPDLGEATDDFVGCDPELGLGYCYNSDDDDQDYGAAPPAMGVDFFQGPIIDETGSTVTLPDGTVLPDKTMLKMTAYVYYNNDRSAQGNPFTAADVWNYMRGIWKDNTPITQGGNGTDPDNPKTRFMFDGDPETATGWLDSNADDRRFLMTTGPFSMQKWEDTDGDGQAEFGEPGVQDIVACVMVARGTNNLNSVTKLKEIDELAQLAYDLNFNLATAPLPPVVNVSTMPNETVLIWDETSEFNTDGTPYESEDPIVADAVGDTVIINNVVTVIDDATYNFYGYSVYQYSDAAGTAPVLIGSWDNGGTAEAEPYESQRFIRILVNKHKDVGAVGEPLVNGKEYYFGVVGQGYLEFGAPTVFSSPPDIVTVIPGYEAGVRYYKEDAYGDTLQVTHTGSSNGSTVVWVVDPSKVTGEDYKVTFNTDLTWNLIRAGTDTLTKNQTNQSGNDAYNVYDGLMVKVMGPSPGINTNIPGAYGDEPGLNGWDFSGNRWLSWGVDWGGSTWFGSWGNGVDFFGEGTLTAGDYVDVELKWAGDTKENQPDRWSKGYVYRRDMDYAYNGLGDVPFTAWDISDTTNPRRLNICFVEMDSMPSLNNPATMIPANGVWDLGWHELPGDTGFTEDGGREYLFIMLSDYDPSGNTYNDVNFGPTSDALYAYWPGPRGSQPYLDGTWELKFFSSVVNTPSDLFEFTAPAAAEVETAYLEKDLDKINVVPNPYYGYHSGEINPFNRWVKFTYLPEKCTIRIFDLAGSLVRKLEKDDATSFLKWNLENEYELPVASGIYVYHVEVPNIGNKIGKMAIFAPNERLDTY